MQFLMWLCNFNPYVVFFVALFFGILLIIFFERRLLSIRWKDAIDWEDEDFFCKIGSLLGFFLICFFILSICLFLLSAKTTRMVTNNDAIFRNSKVVEIVSKDKVYFIWDQKIKDATIITLPQIISIEFKFSFTNYKFQIINLHYLVQIDIQKDLKNYQDYYDTFIVPKRDVAMFVKEILEGFYNNNVEKLRSFDDISRKNQEELQNMIKDFLQSKLKDTGLIYREVKLIL